MSYPSRNIYTHMVEHDVRCFKRYCHGNKAIFCRNLFEHSKGNIINEWKCQTINQPREMLKFTEVQNMDVVEKSNPNFKKVWKKKEER